MPEKLINLTKEHVRLFSVKDWPKYPESMLPKVSCEEPALARKVQGVDEVLRALDVWTIAFPDLKGTVKNVIVQDDMVMAEIQWEGTHNGLLKGPFGEIPATGKRGVINAVELFQFKGEKIVELRHYFDLMTILNQIGVPALAAR